MLPSPGDQMLVQEDMILPGRQFLVKRRAGQPESKGSGPSRLSRRDIRIIDERDPAESCVDRRIEDPSSNRDAEMLEPGPHGEGEQHATGHAEVDRKTARSKAEGSGTCHAGRPRSKRDPISDGPGAIPEATPQCGSKFLLRYACDRSAWKASASDLRTVSTSGSSAYSRNDWVGCRWITHGIWRLDHP